MTALFREQTELEIEISKGRITNVEVPDGKYKLIIPNETSKNLPVVLIQASKISLDDKFMKYRPKTDEEKAFKKLLTEAIKSGLKDFYRPVIDPSFNDDKSGICYEFGRKPAVGKSYNWWKEKARELSSNSRLGTRYEYVAFLGVLIKNLVESGWSISKSWNAVCTDSKELGHYWNSENAKHAFEGTGSREVCGFYDLANTYKILAEDEEASGFWLAGGLCYGNSSNFPLADLNLYDFRYDDHDYGVGWLVLECSTDH